MKQLASDVKSVRVNASGKGFVLFEVGYRYYINAPDALAAITLKPNVKFLSENHISLEIQASYQSPKGKDSAENSNMVVLETELPSGFIVNAEMLNLLKSTLPSIKRIETKNADNVAVLYFDYLSSESVTFEIDGFREHIVKDQKLASVVAYDYYDNGKDFVYINFGKFKLFK